MTVLDIENTALKDALLARMLAHGSASSISDDAASSVTSSSSLSPSSLSATGALDLFLAEFGGIRIRVQVQEGDLSTVLISLATPPSSPEILTSAGLPIGAIEAVREEYAGFAEPLPAAEPGYNVTLRVDLDQLPPEPEARSAIACRLARLRAVVMGAPLRVLLRPLRGDAEEGGGVPASELGIVNAVLYGDKSALLVLPQAEQVDVFWPVTLQRERDAVLAAAFLQVRYPHSYWATNRLHAQWGSRIFLVPWSMHWGGLNLLKSSTQSKVHAGRVTVGRGH